MMDRWNDRWARATDRVGRRWYTLVDRLAARHERVAHRWYRFTQRWADRRDRVVRRWYRRIDRLSARRERVEYRWYRARRRWAHRRDRVVHRWNGLTDRWAGHSEEPHSADRSAVFGSGWVTIVLTTNGSARGPVPGSGAAQAPAFGLRVPDVRGTSASAARRALLDAGLTLERVEAAVGTPGEVLATSPTIGRLVQPETPVTLIVGVERDRASAVALSD